MARVSTSSDPSPDLPLTRKAWLILLAAAAASLGGYLLASALTYQIGFPLDDSWIHLTYARNLALRGEWAFFPGQPSGGSTSPLWSALLAIGFWIRLAPYAWTYALGGLILFGLAGQAEVAVRSAVPSYRGEIPWVGILIVSEWHLAWASASGMETLLHALIVTAVLLLLMQPKRRWPLIGMLAGLSVWVRPDGVTLLGPVVFVAVLCEPDWPKRLRALLLAGIGFGALFVPYLMFNLRVAGTPMPNTFYAKQAEYADWQATPIWERLGQLAIQFLTGIGIALLPGVVLAGGQIVRRRDWAGLAALLWMCGYIGMYVLRLPVYQNGRYVMPAMPIFFIFGVIGFASFRLPKMALRRRGWVVKAAWGALLVALAGSFWVWGARSYGDNVALIESEMVATAKWANANLPPGALVAAHDIGALGYFDNHPIIDLAGLVSPEVVPFIKDQARLAAYLDERGADYYIMFPGYYPLLDSLGTPVFTTHGQFMPSGSGLGNMTIYKWNAP
jgi:hypothetical protein